MKFEIDKYKIYLFTILYVVLQLVLLFPRSEIILIFITAGLALCTYINRVYGTLAIALIFLQTTYPSGNSAGRDILQGNIYTGDFLPFSGIHFVTFAIAISTLITIYRSKRLKLSHLALPIVLVFILSFTTAGTSSVYQFLIDFAMFANIVLWMAFISNSQYSSYHWLEELFLILPLSISFGSIILYLVDVIFGYDISTMYHTVSIFVYAVLLHVSLRGKYGTETRILCGSAVIGYTSIFIHYLIVSMSGSGTILLLAVIGMLCLIVFGRVIDKGTYTLLGTPTLILMGFVIYILGALSSITFPLEGLVFKFTSVFSFDLKQMNRSAAVRIIEFINIVYDLGRGGIPNLMFGNGYGGYFTDSKFPFSDYLKLSTSDYSISEIASHRFYRPHNSPSVLLLKHGLLGIFTYLIVIFTSIKYYLLGNRTESTISIVLLFTFGLVYGFGIKNSILIGICLGFLVSRSKKT